LNRIKRGERIDHYETIRCRKDGSLVDISLSVSPIRSRDGRIIGASKIARDITERRLAEQQQGLLLREMDHRVKNLFSLASSIVTLSARSAATPIDLASAVSSRLAALARAHSMTVPAQSDPGTEPATTLHTLIGTIAAPFAEAESRRISIKGVDLPILASAATGLSLLLHELATNAAKYGALSVPEGTIEIVCEQEAKRLVLTWTECGGPPLEGEPKVEGFGTYLSKATARGQLGGEIVREWRPEGLFVRLAVPRHRLTGE
jgi:two-component sensor histidine kinase